MSPSDEGNRCCESLNITKIINSYLDNQYLVHLQSGSSTHGLEISSNGRRFFIANHLPIFERERKDDKRLYYGVNPQILDWLVGITNGSSDTAYEKLFNHVADAKLVPLMEQLGYSLALFKTSHFHFHYPQLEIGVTLTQPYKQLYSKNRK